MDDTIRHIILIGFMGAGKSTVGWRLAKKMNLTFVDTDHLIEEESGEKISDIFDKYGEEHFRKLETETLLQLSKKDKRFVISVGGGLPMREENQELLKQMGTVVYLEASVDTLLERLRDDTKRPKLRGVDKRARIIQLMSERQTTYEALADVKITTDQRGFWQIIQEIIEKVEGNS